MDKQLLQRFINGSCTAEETIVINEWLQANPEALLSYMQEVWTEDITAPMPAVMEQELRAQLPLPPIPEEVPVVPLPAHKWWRWPAAAAAVLLLVLAAYWGIQHQVIQPANTSAQNIITVPRGKTFKLTLPDNSIAWLKGGSRLQYAEKDYGRQFRTVAVLEGEVFFEVTEDAAHPFIVEQGAVRTRVLGTSFGVKTAAGAPAVITVATGKVAVSYANKVVDVLVAGKQLFINSQNGQHHTSSVPAWAAAAWKEPNIQLKNAGFEEVTMAMEALYGIRLETNNQKVKQQHYTLLLKRQTPVKEVVAVLSLLNHHQYQQKNDTTYIIY